MNAEGRRISSKQTFFYKYIFSFLFIAILAIPIIGVVARSPDGLGEQIGFLPFFIIFAFLFTSVLKQYTKVADEVRDLGDSLLVKHRRRQAVIPLQEVINVSYMNMGNPAQIRLTLRRGSPFGKEFTFLPLSPKGFRWNFFAENPLVEELIDRVDAARRHSGVPGA